MSSDAASGACVAIEKNSSVKACERASALVRATAGGEPTHVCEIRLGIIVPHVENGSVDRYGRAADLTCPSCSVHDGPYTSAPPTSTDRTQHGTQHAARCPPHGTRLTAAHPATMKVNPPTLRATTSPPLR